MGLNMKKLWQATGWLFIAFMLNLNSGCLTPPDTAIVYGPEVAPELIAEALQKAVGENESPSLFKREEVVLKEISRTIRGRAQIDILSSSEITVVEKLETSTQWQIKDVEVLQNYDLTNPQNRLDPIVREDHKCWNKTSLLREACDIAIPLKGPSKVPAARSTVREKLRPFEFFAQDSGPTSEKTITYHNLEVKTSLGAPPPSVFLSPDCRGIPQCQIHLTEIEFDRVNWLDDPEGYKIHYKLKISPDVPALSRFLESCQQGSVKVTIPNGDPNNSPRFMVTFCETVLNFLPGSNP